MNQELTGRFIAQLRKEKNMTQKELADKLGISDKTVSKWETGNGMPDVSLLQPLCEELSVNLNELLSGERLSEESYNGKAEENMMNLAKDAQEGRNNKRRAGIIGAVCGILVFLIFVEFAIICAGGIGGIYNYLDWPTIIIVVGILLGIELIAGRFGRINKALIGAIKKSALMDDESRKLYLQDLKFAIYSTIIASFFTALIGFINLLHTMAEPAAIGPSIGIMSVSFFYGLVIVALIFALRERLKK